MAQGKLPVVAAIPNYNMASELEALLPQVVEQGYDHIFVLDDASTDHSRELAATYAPDVTFVQGQINVGAGGNRNRVLEALSRPTLIHFVDADSELESNDTAAIVADVVPNGEFGMVGCLSKTATGYQRVWNYGPKQSLYADTGSIVLKRIENAIETDPLHAHHIYERYKPILQGWPNPFEVPIRKPVYWNSEHSFIVRSDIFAGLHGFDVRLREHEMQDLAIRIAAAGLGRVFDPTISVRHHNVSVRSPGRQWQKLCSAVKIMRGQGVLSWLFSKEIE